MSISITQVDSRSDWYAELESILQGQAGVQLQAAGTGDQFRPRGVLPELLSLVLASNAIYGLVLILRSFARRKRAVLIIETPSGMSIVIDSETTDEAVHDIVEACS